MIRCVLIDDELNALKALELELQNFGELVTVTARFLSAGEAITYLRSEHTDLVFLDIEMPEMSGLSLLEQLPERSFEVIFTTAYSQYALHAIKKQALDYLLKPIDTDELELALHKARNALQRNPFEARLEAAIERLREIPGMVPKIKLNYDGKILFLSPDEILYCKGEGNYSLVFLENTEKILLTLKLKQLEALLPAALFFRIHNSFIVNLSKVKAYHKADGMIELNPGVIIPVSREKRSDILNKL